MIKVLTLALSVDMMETLQLGLRILLWWHMCALVLRSGRRDFRPAWVTE